MSANLSRMSAVSWPLIQTHQVTMNNGWMEDGWTDGRMDGCGHLWTDCVQDGDEKAKMEKCFADNCG